MICLTWGDVVDRTDVSQTDAPSSCQGKLEVPTVQEKEALDAMRSIKERVRALNVCRLLGLMKLPEKYWSWKKNWRT